MFVIRLKKGREKPIVRGHPWIFSGAIQNAEGSGAPGESCKVAGADGRVLGHGYYNPSSSIAVRMLTKGDIVFDAAELRKRLDTAFVARKSLLASADTDSCRLLNAEGDFLPGLIVDTFAGGLCVQLLTSGMERMRAGIMAELHERLSPPFIFERSDTEAREREGLRPAGGPVSGDLPKTLIIKENGLRFGVDIAGGQKTGFYFDQRNNRMLVRDYASGKCCLDCFTYSGAFAVNMFAAGACSVTAVDSSKAAIERCGGNIALNGFDSTRTACICANVFDFLRETDTRFECIVLDPPKFAKHPSEVQKASRGYKDINLIAIKKIAPGGVLFTFSCSNAIDTLLFRQIVFAAAADAGRPVQVLHILSAGSDHPVNIAHPEGEYLKGLVVRVL